MNELVALIFILIGIFIYRVVQKHKHQPDVQVYVDSRAFERDLERRAIETWVTLIQVDIDEIEPIKELLARILEQRPDRFHRIRSQLTLLREVNPKYSLLWGLFHQVSLDRLGRIHDMEAELVEEEDPRRIRYFRVTITRDASLETQLDWNWKQEGF